MKICLITAAFIILVESLVKGIVIHKVKVGDTAILPCPSNDKLHRFQYWQLKNDQIIGPWNNNEKVKIRYEIWSGRLIIRSVSETESGFYKCFSKQILGSELQSETVELLVRRDWEEDFENDSKVNAYRAIIAILVLLILIMVGIMLYFIKSRRSSAFQELREGSPEELIPSSDSRGVYRSTSVSMTKPSSSWKKSPDRSLENAVVETDISTSFLLSN